LAALDRKPDLLLCLSAGNTPTRLYDLLAAEGVRTPARFSRLRLIKIDEWGGLAHGAPGTCEAQIQRQWLMPLGIEAHRYCGFAGAPADPEAECKRVEAWLHQHGPIDLCILGLGLNGHIALNEPAEALSPHAHVAALAPTSLTHSMLLPEGPTPTCGMTLGVGNILASRRLLLLVVGAAKRGPLHRLLTDRRIATSFPASFLRLHPDVTVIADAAAAGS
jgi:galactosamine-6-phosphate isomerase